MNEYKYHRVRREREIECAIKAASDSVAERHLQLARLHDQMGQRRRLTIVANGPVVISRTDKEA